MSGPRSAQLCGTGRIADDLYLLSHDDRTGKPYLHALAIGTGLAGGLLAELILQRCIDVTTDAVFIINSAVPDDDLARLVLELLRSERELHPLRSWLQYLAHRAAQDVAERLEYAGYLMQVKSRLPGRAPRWAPVDADCAFASHSRVHAVLRAPELATAAEITLAGQAAACGLASRLFPYGPAEAQSHLQAAIGQLHPGLREVIAQTQTAVDSAVLAQRV